MIFRLVDTRLLHFHHYFPRTLLHFTNFHFCSSPFQFPIFKTAGATSRRLLKSISSSCSPVERPPQQPRQYHSIYTRDFD